MSDSFGSWQLDALIAVGGLGEIWRAHRSSEIAAVKRIHTHLIRNDEARDQFAQEQMLAKALPRHANLVHAIEADAVADRPYVALELAPGEDLRRIIAPAATPQARSPRRAVIPRSRAVSIIRAACAGASHMHAHGWVHGDLNHSNLVVDAQPSGDRVVVIDLGIARRVNQSGTPRGTHAYMAPEQIRGEAWTPALDVFALGVVLWELLAGERLFHRGPSYLSMQAVMTHVPGALPDPDLNVIVQRALAKDQTQRIQTTAELSDLLSRPAS
ncbi:MAG TPA: serine/threonine-protein kinase [Kofleriaceae bacterium]